MSFGHCRCTITARIQRVFQTHRLGAEYEKDVAEAQLTHQQELHALEALKADLKATKTGALDTAVTLHLPVSAGSAVYFFRPATVLAALSVMLKPVMMSFGR